MRRSLPSGNLLLLLLAFIFVSAVNNSIAQTKVGYIDSKRIIESMQESVDAKQRLENLVSQWQGELKTLQDSLKSMKDDYDKKKLILTEQLRQQKETEIKDMETSVGNFRVQKFGEGGEYFTKQTEFMKPVYDRIFKAIETVAKEEKYDYVFDRSSDILLLYVNENHDLTAKVSRAMEGK
jgi:Skp family chaperone for outer membrane proteins